MRKESFSFPRIFILASASIALFGFRAIPDTLTQPPDQEIENLEGWIEFAIEGDAESNDGHNTAQIVWHPVQDMLPVVLSPATGRPVVLSETLYSVMEWDGTHADGLGTSFMVFPISWEISAIVHQDCSVEFFIDEEWYPGTVVVCMPIAGCVPDVNQPAYFKNGGSMTIPFDKGYEEIPWGDNVANVDGSLMITIHSMTIGGECEIVRYSA